MPLLTILIARGGAMVDIAVAVSIPREKAMRGAGKQVPQPAFVRGLIDTGASCTCVDPRVIEHLELTPTGVCQMLTPSTGTSPHDCNQYDVALFFLMSDQQMHLASVTLPVAESSLSHHGFDVLIGRDVLANGVLFYNGKESTVTIAY